MDRYGGQHSLGADFGRARGLRAARARLDGFWGDGKLAAAWWQWALSEPADTNPLIGGYTDGPQCDGQPLTDTLAQEWFLGGSFGASAVERTCTVPVGTQLFFPAFNIAILRDPANPGDTEAHLFDQAHGYVDAALADPDFSMVVTVDGKAVPTKRIVRAEAGIFSGESPLLVSETNPSGSYEAVTDGYWVTLPPLSKGEHTIAWKVSAPNADTDPFTEGVQHLDAGDHLQPDGGLTVR